jgi:hypothetical protein
MKSRADRTAMRRADAGKHGDSLLNSYGIRHPLQVVLDPN